MSFDEFKAVNRLCPVTLKQSKAICKAIDKFIHEHPELHSDIEAYYQLKLEKVLRGLT